MQAETTPIPGMLLITSPIFRDPRGFFTELYHAAKLAEAGLGAIFVQDNLSRSTQGTLRGLHYQVERPQGKLVRVLEGEVFDVAVDLRQSSPACGRWYAVQLDAASGRAVYIPPGCAHGFYVLSQTADVFYKCTDLYAPALERTLLWNDPVLGIDWPLTGEPLVSDKDARGIRFHDCERFA